jgi:hypothetical protein
MTTFAIVFLILLKVFEPKKTPEWEIDRTIRYGFTLENKTSNPMRNIVFKTYSPLTISSTQKLENLESNRNFTTQIDEFGNQVMLFDIDFIAPYAKKNISITAGLILSKIAAGANTENEIFVSKQPLIDIENKAIKKLALGLGKNTENPQKVFFDWLVDNINYSGYGMQDKGASYAINNLAGDCTEYAYLNVALNRVIGVPSRAVNGYVVNHDTKLNISELHTWSEVWMDDGWQVIDAQKNNYLENQQDYIAMNIVIDTFDNPNQFKKFWVSKKDIVVTIK